MLRHVCLSLVIAMVVAGCSQRDVLNQPVTIKPHENTCEVLLDGPPEVGRLRLWGPEGIMSGTGSCAVYPRGETWKQQGDLHTHHVEGEGIYGPGNFIKVGPNTYECVGIQIPGDRPVKWDTAVKPIDDGVEFTIELTNVGAKTIQQACAAICLKFNTIREMPVMC